MAAVARNAHDGQFHRDDFDEADDLRRAIETVLEHVEPHGGTVVGSLIHNTLSDALNGKFPGDE